MLDGLLAYLVFWALLGLLAAYSLWLVVRPLRNTRAWWVPGAVLLVGAAVRLGSLPEYGAGFESLAGIGLLVFGSLALVAMGVSRVVATTAPAAPTEPEPVAPMPRATVVQHRAGSTSHRSLEGA